MVIDFMASSMLCRLGRLHFVLQKGFKRARLTGSELGSEEHLPRALTLQGIWRGGEGGRDGGTAALGKIGCIKSDARNNKGLLTSDRAGRGSPPAQSLRDCEIGL